MRIGIDSRLPYYQMGGISQYILYLLPALAKIDPESRYIVFHSRKDSNNYIPQEAGNFKHGVLYTPCHHRIERWSLSLELVRHRLDVLHSPDFIPPTFGARRKVVTVHDLNFMYYPDFLTADSRRYYSNQIEWAVRTADHIIADSNHTRQDLVEILGVSEEKITTVYLAANPLYRKPRSPEEIDRTLKRFGLEENFVLFVGTLSPRKNISTLMTAYSRLVEESRLNVPLVLVGSKGWLSEEVFEQIGNLRMGSRIRHLENVSDVELACLYSAAGLLALPSFYEGFGLPPLEAMHCGCPVVSSDRGSLPEVIGEAGFYVDPDDVDGWVAAMDRFLTDKALRDTSIGNGFAQANQFSWERTAQMTLAIYKNLAP